MSILEQLIEEDPERPWSWDSLSANPGISTAFIQRHPEFPWSWRSVSKNPSLSFNFLIQNLDLDWDWASIEIVKKLSLPQLKTLLSLSKEKAKLVRNIALNPNITLDFFTDNFKEHLYFDSLVNIFSNPSLNLSQIIEYYPNLTSSYFRLNPNVSVEEVRSYFNSRILFDISFNKKLKIEVLDYFADENLDWERGICSNKNLTLNFFRRHLDKPWSYKNLSANSDLPIEIVEAFPDKEWYFPYLSQNRNLTPEFVEKNLNKLWDWRMVVCRENLNPDFLKKIERLTNWSYLSLNPNLTFDFIRKNERRIDWSSLSENNFSGLFRTASLKIGKAYRNHRRRDLTRKLLLLSSKLNTDLLLLIGERYLWVT